MKFHFPLGINRIILFSTALGLLLVLNLFYRSSLEGEYPSGKKGILDYQSLAFADNGKLLLRGEWEIYWNRFYFPSDFRAGGGFPLQGREFTDFSSSWSSIPSRGEEGKKGFKGFNSPG